MKSFYTYYTAVLNGNTDLKYPDGGIGFICVRVDKTDEVSKGKTLYKTSFSFCAPGDTPKKACLLNKHFRALSRKIADDRMKTNRVKAYIEFYAEDDKPLNDLFEQALKLGMSTEKPNNKNRFIAPDWVLGSEIESGIQKKYFAA